MSEFLYYAYGLPIRSQIELPELLPLAEARATYAPEAPSEPFVEIEMGPVPEALEGQVRPYSWLAHAGSRWLVTAPDAGRMLIEDGGRIVLDHSPDNPHADLRPYLMGTGLATAVMQRGRLPLHVSALLSPAGVIAFTGPSGAGKSTAAAQLHVELGWPMISDDVAVLSIRDGRPMLEGGVLRMRLWADALERLDWSQDGLTRDQHRVDKFVVQDRTPFIGGPQPFEVLYEIASKRSEPESVEQRGAERFKTLMNAIYRPYIATKLQGISKIQSTIASAVLSVKTISGPRPSSSDVIVLPYKK